MDKFVYIGQLTATRRNPTAEKPNPNRSLLLGKDVQSGAQRVAFDYAVSAEAAQYLNTVSAKSDWVRDGQTIGSKWTYGAVKVTGTVVDTIEDEEGTVWIVSVDTAEKAPSLLKD